MTIYTLGCKLNQLESEAIADSFRKAGFPLVPWGTLMEGPGLIIINTCTVTSKAEQKARRIIRQALRENPQACVIAVGCYAQLDHGEIAALGHEAGEPGFRRLFVLGGADAGSAKSPLLDLPGYLIKTNKDSSFVHIRTHSCTLSSVIEAWIGSALGEDTFGFTPEEFAFHSRGYLKIQDGCDNACTFCRTRLARGPSVSLPPAAALDQLLSLESKGCAELMLTGINITQYRHPGFGLAELLQYLLEGSSSIALRLASLEPEAITEKLAPALAHPRIRPHFHLSVQSGSDAVLQKMGRAYDSRTVENAAALLRSVKDKPFLACDIIAGFPGETEDDFAQTIALCERIGFAWIHAFPYSPRPGTPAFRFGKPVCERDVRRRVELLTSLALRGRRDYAQLWLGRELSAVVEKGPCSAGQCRAVSENYLKILVNCPGAAPPPGSVLRCVPVAMGGDDGESVDLVADVALFLS